MANTNLKDYEGKQLNPTTTADLVSITKTDETVSDVQTELNPVVDNAVRYTVQNRTEEEREIARSNLGISATGVVMEAQISESRDEDISEGDSYTVLEYEMNVHALQVFVDGLLTLEGIEWQEESTTSIKFLGDVSKDSSIVVYARG